MVILGVDPGSRFLGLGVISVESAGEPVYRHSEVLQLAPNLAMELRLSAILSFLDGAFLEHRPGAFALERSFFGKNAASAFSLGQVRGVCLAVAGKHRVPTYEYSPKSVKKGVTGLGAATKDQMVAFARARLKISGHLAFDAADALGLAIYHALQSRQLEVLNRLELQQKGVRL